MILAGAVIAYFIIFPDDLSAFFAPAREILSLSNAVSPWLYALLVSGVIAWTLARCFGRPRDLTAR
jgi:Na+-driven multidrug efflux pump